MTTYVYIGHSIDGYIADKDGGIDWLNETPNPDSNDLGFAEFMSKVDAIVMGRNTFDVVKSFGEWFYTKPVYVISSKLKELPEKYTGKADVLNLAPAQIIEELKRKGCTDLYIDGGTLVQSFLAEDLIDELILTALPILLGGGISLFGELVQPLKFELIKSEVLLSSLVKNHYRRKTNRDIL